MRKASPEVVKEVRERAKNSTRALGLGGMVEGLSVGMMMKVRMICDV